jgi:hypothetical protein
MSLPREVYERHFAEGGSVLLPGGRHIMRLEDMPSEFELAEGDAGRQSAILAQEEADLAARQERVARLRAQVQSASDAGGKKTDKPDPQADLRTKLEALTVAELGAEADAAGVMIPADVTRKADIVDFLLKEAAKG